jgi:outer membrane protein assembly factor BamA
VRDNRDNVNYPTSGSYRRIDVTFSQGVWGSEYSYNRFRIDARKFIALPRSHVLAVRGYAASAPGDAPFTQLPRLGGSSLMRGFFTGRYRDHALIAAQVEYRLPLVWRLGAVAFGSAGQVAPSVGLLAIDRFRFAGGGGLRFTLVPSEKVNIRMDLAMAGSSSGFYLALGEAF